mmetsp:Transcript_117639/g.344481  ORF Transcript_117639/g.344481 Transcript_117639/m.344481 type:complete len:259 (+) Transcript_117639:467-1243(+)
MDEGICKIASAQDRRMFTSGSSQTNSDRPQLDLTIRTKASMKKVPPINIQADSPIPPYLLAIGLPMTICKELNMHWPKKSACPSMRSSQFLPPPIAEPLAVKRALTVIHIAPPEASATPAARMQEVFSWPSHTASSVVKMGRAACQVLPTVGFSCLRPMKKQAWAIAKKRPMVATLGTSPISGRDRPFSALQTIKKKGPTTASLTSSNSSGLAPRMPNFETKEPPPKSTKTLTRAPCTAKVDGLRGERLSFSVCHSEP